MIRLDLCIPAFNEAPYLATTLHEIRRITVELPGITTQILIAENGSTDGTAEVAEALRFADTTVLRVPGKGKGIAVRTAAQASHADIFGFIDADLSADPAHLPALLAPLTNNTSDIVIGSRLLDPSQTNRGYLRTFTSRIFHKLAYLLLRLPHHDTQCGLKLMNRAGADLLRQGTESGWFFDLELLALAHQRGLRVLEIPIAWQEERFNGRKSKLRVVQDGWQAIKAFFRIRSRLNTRV